VVLVVALTNGLDVLDAVASQRWAQVPGALVFAVAFTAVGIWLVRWPWPTAD
jgi:hypothetical protein